ncbi:MAG: cation diffusion facilitator family transporter [Clostridiales bacterium]|nr:cation diffusion facilitator family transporter [Clostridiales bacterium]
MEQTLTQPMSRENLGARVGILSAAGNLLLFACKYTAGITCGNVAVLAEGYDNLMYALNSLLVLLGFRMSGRKGDSLHPYGHGRVEYVLGLIISMTIILAGVSMFRESIHWIRHPRDRSLPLLVYEVSLLSILVKCGMSAYTRHVNRELDSMALAACEQNEAADIKMTMLTIGSAALYSLTGLSADWIVGIMISVLVMKDGFQSFISHFTLLLGEGISGQQQSQIQAVFDARKELVTLKQIDFHDYGPERRIVSLQITVNPSCSQEEVNGCMDGIEGELRALGLSPVFSLSMEQILG